LRWRSEVENEEVSETVWLPVAIAASRRHADASARATRKSTIERAHFVVERVLGHGWAVSCDPVFVAVDGADGNADETPAVGDGAMLPARLAVEDCRKSVTNLAARASFTFTRGRSLTALELEPVRAGRYPFRLRYRRRPSQRIDFEAVDAVTGRRAGSSLRAAIAAALIDADRSRARS
jgi:hypothetical protein